MKALGLLLLLCLLAAFVLPGLGGYLAAGLALACIAGLVLWVLARPGRVY